jgi:hypothetical protein
MLTPRRVILAAVAAFLAVISLTVYSLLQPPDSGGVARDSYGTRREGQRGLFEAMHELGLSVERRVEPPGRDLPAETTLVLWGPDEALVSMEPRHLQRLAGWVRAGGRVVLAAPRPIDVDWAAQTRSFDGADISIWEALGLDEVTTEELTSSDLPLLAGSPPPNLSDPAQDDPHGLLAGWTTPDAPRTAVDVRATGTLVEPARGVTRLTVPADRLFVVDADDRRPDGTIEFRDVAGATRVLAAAWKLDAGEVVAIGDPMLFNNFALAHDDNSVLAVQLLAEGDRPVLFDEFYHGLSVRGNPFWLLTKPGYALLVVAVIGLICVRTWRAAVLLGPPLTTPEPSRRAIGEYVDAMSRFFHRGRRTRSFLLETVSEGVLRHVATEHGLAQAKLDVERIAAAVARRDPDRAERLRAASRAVDAVLAKRHKGGERETVRAMQELAAVL